MKNKNKIKENNLKIIKKAKIIKIKNKIKNIRKEKKLQVYLTSNVSMNDGGCDGVHVVNSLVSRQILKVIFQDKEIEGLCKNEINPI